MAFVSLTDGTRLATEAFAAAAGAKWPHGYRVPPAAIARLADGSGQGRTVMPAMYLVGPDGRVVWTDGQARPRHRIPPDEVVRELVAAVEEALRADGR